MRIDIGAPWQVQIKPCVFAATHVLSLVVGSQAAPSAQEARSSCADLSAYARSVVSISRYFDKARNDGDQEIVAERATAWFYTSPRHLVTAAHFVKGLPAGGLHDVELRQRFRQDEPDTIVQTQLRIAVQGRIFFGNGAGQGTDLAEDVAILKLQDPFPHAQVLDVGSDIPSKNAAVLVLGSPGARSRQRTGSCARPGVRLASMPV